jgi:hypothetical protein
MKNIFKTFFIIGISFVLTGCSLNSAPSPVADKFNEPKEKDAKIPISAPINCGQDTACADNLMADCAVGSFILGPEFSLFKYSVLGKASGGCSISLGYVNPTPTFTGVMTCLVPVDIKNSSALHNEYLSAEMNKKFVDCSGELKDAFLNPIKRDEGKDCADNSACIDTLLASCSLGSFSVDDDNGKAMKFKIINSSTGNSACAVDASYAKNPQENLVGPTMRCLFNDIKSLSDVRNLMKNNFIATQEKYGGGSLCSGDLYKLIK